MRSATPPSAKKLLLSKWTAVTPVNREKHFLVVKVVEPQVAGAAITMIEIESVYSKRVTAIAWRDLTDQSRWTRGWV